MIHARKDYDHIQDPSGKIAADEPVFLLRAKDVMAPGLLVSWAEELISRGGDKEMAGMVADHAMKMIAWQETNRCKLPDLPTNYNELPSSMPVQKTIKEEREALVKRMNLEGCTGIWVSSEADENSVFCWASGESIRLIELMSLIMIRETGFKQLMKTALHFAQVDPVKSEK